MYSVRCRELLFISTPTVDCAHAHTAPKRGRGEFAEDAQEGGVRDNVGSASKRGRGGDGSRAAEDADTPEVERGALEPRFSQAMEAETDGGRADKNGRAAKDVSPGRSTTKRWRGSLSGKSVLFVGFDCPEVPMCEPMCGVASQGVLCVCARVYLLKCGYVCVGGYV
jgi:hypothetical protein